MALGELATAYLRRLAMPGTSTEPDLHLLRRLHVAHVERVAYESLDLYRGRPPSIELAGSAARVAGGRGGYCFTLGGAMAWLLRELGYDVRLHPARVQATEAADVPRPGVPEVPGDTPDQPNHLWLTVHGLDAVPWLVDVGLGDALHEPVPLRESTFWQGPFRYALRRSSSELGPGWWLQHAPDMSFGGAHLADPEVDVEHFAGAHERLGSSPASGFVRLVSAHRRLPDRVESLRGRTLRVVDGAGSHQRVVDSPLEWWGLLGDVFGLRLADVDAAEREQLWARVSADHEEWVRQGPPS
ncbi:arylamine N-acetyltransferase [Angustibacter peucedani]